MSGCNFESSCPNCGKECIGCSDTKPFDMSTLQCTHCGFYTSLEVKYMTLEELNDFRENMDLKPLKKLPSQTFQL